MSRESSLGPSLTLEAMESTDPAENNEDKKTLELNEREVELRKSQQNISELLQNNNKSRSEKVSEISQWQMGHVRIIQILKN
jgi:hypothetical protein